MGVDCYIAHTHTHTYVSAIYSLTTTDKLSAAHVNDHRRPAADD